MPLPPADGERRPWTSLSVGFLALLPLFGAYEWSRAAGLADRNTSELLVSLPLRLLGEAAPLARRLLLAAVAVASFVLVRRRGWPLGSAVFRVVGEGVLAGVALGPLLLLASHLLGVLDEGVGLGAGPGVPAEAPLAAFVFGGAGWEELVFRVGLQSAVFLVVLRGAAPRSDPSRTDRVVAEVVSLATAAMAFGAFHLQAFTRFLGHGGEPFDPALFAWRVLAGVFLGVLFRWRGPGVAGWAHGLFNASLVLGAGPGVFR